MSPKRNVETFPASPDATSTEATDHTCCDILSATESIRALGDCCANFAEFLDDAQPSELRWLAEALEQRLGSMASMSESAGEMLYREERALGLRRVYASAKEEKEPASRRAETGGPSAPVISAAPEDSENSDWLTKTPEVTYDLMMFDATGDEIQGIDLSRAEFIALKAELGRMRGIAGARKAGKATS